MSWNADLGVLVDTALTELNPTGRTAEIDDIGGRIGGWQAGVDTVLYARSGAGRDAYERWARRLGRQLYAVTLAGTVDTYVIEAVGPIERLRVLVEGEVVEERGEPLPAEHRLAEFADDDEYGHFAVLSDLAGVDFWTLSDRPATLLPATRGGFLATLFRGRR